MVSNLDEEESYNTMIIKCAKTIDLSLADIFDMTGKKNQSPCNIELVLKRSSDKTVIHKTLMSYHIISILRILLFGLKTIIYK